MARNESESEFDRFVAQNAMKLQASRGATSKYRPTELDKGRYYVMLNKAERAAITIKVWQYNEATKKREDTGQTKKGGEVTIQAIVLCALDDKMPIPEREAWAGIQAYIRYTIDPDLQDSWDRLASDLETIGVPTRKFVPDTTQITNPQMQITMAQGLDMITRSKPFGIIEVTPASTGTAKYVNYRDAVSKEDIERYLGHAIDVAQFINAANTVSTQPTQYLDGTAMSPGQQQMPSGVPVPQSGMPALPGMGMPSIPSQVPDPNVPPWMVQGTGVIPQNTGMGYIGSGPGQMPPIPVHTTGQLQASSAQVAPQQPPVYPAIGAPFFPGGNPATLQPQPDGTFYDTASKNWYTQQGAYVPITPPLPQPPPVNPGNQSAAYQQPLGTAGGMPAVNPQQQAYPTTPGQYPNFPGSQGGLSVPGGGIPQPPPMPGR